MQLLTKPVTGDSGRAHTERTDCLRDAKNDLANGYEYLKTGYFGVKNYSGLAISAKIANTTMVQNTVLSFSLSASHAICDNMREGDALSHQEIEDTLYLLSVLPQTEKAPAIAA